MPVSQKNLAATKNHAAARKNARRKKLIVLIKKTLAKRRLLQQNRVLERREHLGCKEKLQVTPFVNRLPAKRKPFSSIRYMPRDKICSRFSFVVFPNFLSV
ncbi:hypothetical protein ABH13_3486 [Bacillus velezensis]|nr:hypothetical protein ABH13_3486 [Bacillus velezensis]